MSEIGASEARSDGKRRPGAAVVYFVRATILGLVKIGVASDIRSRLANLQVGSPDRLELVGVMRAKDALAKEMELHGRFRADHSHGEWFRMSPELSRLIAFNHPDMYYREETNGLRALLEAVDEDINEGRDPVDAPA
ncbi:MAG: Mx8p19 [Phenylobacterium sp.]|nr:Mx8p19 [Phenylobacterium sp.]